MAGQIKGQRLPPAILDHLAATNPSRIYAAIPKSLNLDDGFRDITMLEMSHAVDALAFWIKSTYGCSDTFETLGYLGLNDLKYPVAWLAAIKCGYNFLVFSARNTIDQNVHILQESCCKILLHDQAVSKLVSALGTAVAQGLSTGELADLDHWLHVYKEPFPYIKTLVDAMNDPILTLHTSGSTGNPKLATKTNGAFAASDRPLPNVPGREVGGINILDYEGEGFYYSPFPPSHLAGITALGYYPLFMKSAAVILGLPDRPPSIDMIVKILKARRMRVLYLPPVLIEALAQIPEAMDIMKSLDGVVFAGGPLALPVGDVLSKHVKLSSSYGSTEIGNVPCLLPKDPADWSWMEFHPAIKVDMDPSVEDSFELILRRDIDADQYRGITHAVPPIEGEFRSRDLFKPHPSKPNLWQFYGRNDDIIVFNNGEKWNPIPSEGVISQHHLVTGVLIVGNGRFEPAILIEPKEDQEDLIELLWPTISSANANAQRFGQISRSKVAVVPPGGLIRAPKGSIVRSLTIKKFAHVIERLYASDQTLDGSAEPSTPGDILTRVRGVVHAFIPTLNDEVDIFAAGLDSLQATEMARRLGSSLCRNDITAETVFRNPSIVRLTHRLRGGESERHETMHEMFGRLAGSIKSTKSIEDVEGFTIALIGSTGSLGSEIFSQLSRETKVGRIVCYNRDATRAKETASTIDESNSKCQTAFFSICLHEPHFGLDDEGLAHLKRADVVINCAWHVNFNLSLSSFEALVSGALSLSRWLATLQSPPRLIFVSSIASVVGNQSLDPVVEDTCDLPARLPTGYGESKAVTEALLAKVSREHSLSTAIVRVGQIAGSSASCVDPQRAWSKKEWVYAMMKSSKSMGKLPGKLPMAIDWIPVDQVAACIRDLVSSQRSGLEVFNLVNPTPVNWTSLSPAIAEYMNSELCDFGEWLDELRQMPSHHHAEYPAIALLPFFENVASAAGAVRCHTDGGLHFHTDKMRAGSSSFSLIGPITSEDMIRWIKEWHL